MEIWDSLSAEEKIEGMKILAMVTASVSENLTNKTFMVGISNAIEAIGDPDRYAERVLKGFAASFVPTALYYYRKGEDPYMREISSVWDAFMNRLPGYSEQLPLRRNVLGEPMKFPPGLGGRFSPIRMSKIKKDPVYQEFLDIGYFPTTPDKTVRGVKITNKQYSELLEFQQNQLALRANLQFLINQPTWKRMNKFAKKEQLDQVIQGTQKRAEDMLWNKYRDELEEKWRKQKKETYPRVEPLQ